MVKLLEVVAWVILGLCVFLVLAYIVAVFGGDDTTIRLVFHIVNFCMSMWEVGL